jgi:WD40 repeat protein
MAHMLTATLRSQHILRRTNLQSQTGTLRPRPSEGRIPEWEDDNDKASGDEQSITASALEPLSRTDTTIGTVDDRDTRKDIKKGVKAVSFLSRLMGGTKKKDVEEEVGDDESSSSGDRPEGNDAQVFTQQLDNMGYQPRHPQPPAYIKVRAKHKRERDFDRLFLAQELSGRKPVDIPNRNGGNKLRRKTSPSQEASDTVWAMEFSKDGKYLAAAGKDMIVRVWAVLGSPEDRQKHERQESRADDSDSIDSYAEHLSAPVFQSKPIREYEGHTSTVLDLSWSKNNFLLSSSMDKTVRLWHASRAECLCTFKHSDFVPSIAFHPKDDRFFLAGSLDSKLRLWSIPDKSVAFAAQVPDMITAVAFTPDGKHAMAGCLTGLCMFFETEGLKYQTQIHVRSTRGQNSKGSKITGIQAFNSSDGDTKVLITSNDSRIRLYNFRDKSLELKFRGNENNCSQIRASLSDDGRYVVCGSEDKKAYIWSLHQGSGERRDKTPVEMFDAHNTVATVVCMAPMKTRQHLSRSEDPVYTLCNPPPVTLLSSAEQRAETQSIRSSIRPQSQNGSINYAPSEIGRFRESPAYLSRSAHTAGNIIVTADYTGNIKVFRQDCGWSKRIRDDGDRASLFSKKGSKSGRASSLATKSSMNSLREPRRSADRILSWRQGIAMTPAIPESKVLSRTYPPSRGSIKPSERSMSPRKSTESRKGTTVENGTAGSIKSAHPLAADALVRSPSPINNPGVNEKGTPSDSLPSSHSSPLQDGNPISLDGSRRSRVFWDQKVWEAHAQRIHQIHEVQVDAHSQLTASDDADHLALRQPLQKVPSFVSKLSTETVSDDEDDQFDDAREHGEDGPICALCGSTSLSALNGLGGTTLTSCNRCGTSAATEKF